MTGSAHRLAVAVTTALAAATVLAACTAAPAPRPALHTPAGPAGSASAPQNPAAPTLAPPVEGLTVTRIRIPAIGVDAPIELLDTDTSGTLLPPVQWQSAGWYRQGVVPGQVGPAVIAGHIDSDAGPAVFARLDQVQAGTEIDVALSDGSTVRFTADHSIDVSKRAFPTQDVYGAVPTPQLRLISCTGQFDPAVGHYKDNLVVFADLAPTPK